MPLHTDAVRAVHDPVCLSLRLRVATDAAHRRLEQSLDLLGAPPSRDRFAALLQRFWGFHAVWEPAIRRHPALDDLMTDRCRLDLLGRDLAALGLSRGDIDGLPLCGAAAGLTLTAERTLGSLYVLEGSTLGGRIITRALQDAPWAPAGGLRYFDPYGARTGAMWRAMQQRLNAASAPAVDAAIESGALGAFEVLQDWLAPGVRRP